MSPHIKIITGIMQDCRAHIIVIWEETWWIYAEFMSGHRKKIPLTCGHLVVAAAYERVKKCACVISHYSWTYSRMVNTHTHAFIWSFIIFFHDFYSYACYLYDIIYTSCDVHKKRGTRIKHNFFRTQFLYEMWFH